MCPPARRASGSCGPPRRLGASGVRHIRIASVSDVPGCMTSVVVVWRAELRESDTATVGQDEDSLATMGATDVGSGKQVPDCIEPEVGQVAEYGGQSAALNKG